jgi:hypothetical protein
VGDQDARPRLDAEGLVQSQLGGGSQALIKNQGSEWWTSPQACRFYSGRGSDTQRDPEQNLAGLGKRVVDALEDLCPMRAVQCRRPQQTLYLRPEPHGHGSLRLG